MPPPPAEQFASRILLGPALRAQPDRRLVRLVRDGYEAAFEEIVRRYRRPLDRFAASIVGGGSEDVTQDAFSKALLALRGTEAEIDLRPWLYRIVRNTALNALRDRPPATEELVETIRGGTSVAAAAERREEMTELMQRLQALPEPQRAAIVMRELEGLSHEEIAGALGVSGGAARQAIHRARTTLRDGLGMLIPLPLLRVLFDHGAEAAGAGGAAAAGAASTAGSALGGLGAGGALKLGAATVLIAGSVGAGVAIQHDHGGSGEPEPASASAADLPASGASLTGGSANGRAPVGPVDASGGQPGSGSGPGGRGGGGSPGSGVPGSGHSAGPGTDGQGGHGGSDGGGQGRHSGSAGSGEESGDSQSGGHDHGDRASGGSVDGQAESGGHHGGSGDSGGGSDTEQQPTTVATPPPPEDGAQEKSGDGSESGSGSGDSSSEAEP